MEGRRSASREFRLAAVDVVPEADAVILTARYALPAGNDYIVQCRFMPTAWCVSASASRRSTWRPAIPARRAW